MDERKTHRLICVYTADFSNLDDVLRVLSRLVELGLVQPPPQASYSTAKKGFGKKQANGGGGNQGIFYKCDAYTYLDLQSGNEYKVRASMYSSRELLARRT